MDELTPLLLAARDGDRSALSELVRRAQPDVWRFCAAGVGVARADDVTQETFVRVWQSARTFRAEASARTWILAIARRAIADAGRRQARLPTPTAAEPATTSPDHGDDYALQDLIGRLDPDRRAAFVLTQVIGLPYQQVAEVCGCPIGTVRSRVARARADLVAWMAAGTDEGGTDEGGTAEGTGAASPTEGPGASRPVAVPPVVSGRPD